MPNLANLLRQKAMPYLAAGVLATALSATALTPRTAYSAPDEGGLAGIVQQEILTTPDYPESQAQPSAEGVSPAVLGAIVVVLLQVIGGGAFFLLRRRRYLESYESTPEEIFAYRRKRLDSEGNWIDSGRARKFISIEGTVFETGSLQDSEGNERGRYITLALNEQAVADIGFYAISGRSRISYERPALRFQREDNAGIRDGRQKLEEALTLGALRLWYQDSDPQFRSDAAIQALKLIEPGDLIRASAYVAPGTASNLLPAYVPQVLAKSKATSRTGT